MKKVLHSILVIFIISFCLCSCKENKVTKSGEIIAYYDKEPIYMNEIDMNLEGEYYDALLLIYNKRKEQLNRLMINKMLVSESQKHDLDIQGLIDRFQYIDSSIQSSIFRRADYDSIKATRLIAEYKEYLLQTHIDSLKTIHAIDIALQPPKIPESLTKNITKFDVGNIDSEINVWIISDPECSSCKLLHPIIDKLIQKYGDRVKFSFSLYSINSTLSIKMLCAASKQDMFIQMYHLLMEKEKIVSTNEQAIELATEAGLNIDLFNQEIDNKQNIDSIDKSNQMIYRMGINAVPVIIINNHTYTGNLNLGDIGRAIYNNLK